MVIAVKVVKAIIVRCALLLHATMTVWRVTVDLDNPMYWMLGLGIIPFLVEGVYTIIKRKGDDFLIFTPCFFFYLTTTIPCVWLLELHKTVSFQKGDDAVLNNDTAEIDITGLPNISPTTWTILIEELLLYLLIISRWLLPRGGITREQLSELLFAFIGIASDIMEMFSLFGESQVRNNTILSYCLLGVWSLSVLQFSMTVTVTHQPKRAKKIKVIDYNDEKAHSTITIRNEILAILVSMFMQDIPFLSLRLYTIITYNLVTYSLVFFTAKNCLVISLLIYKIAVLLQKRYCPEVDFKKGNEGDEEIVGDDEENMDGGVYVGGAGGKEDLDLDEDGIVVDIPEKDKSFLNGGRNISGNSTENAEGDGLKKRSIHHEDDDNKNYKIDTENERANDNKNDIQASEEKEMDSIPKQPHTPSSTSTPQSSRPTSSDLSSNAKPPSYQTASNAKNQAAAPGSANTTTTSLPTPPASATATPVPGTPKVSTSKASTPPNKESTPKVSTPKASNPRVSSSPRVSSNPRVSSSPRVSSNPRVSTPRASRPPSDSNASRPMSSQQPKPKPQTVSHGYGWVSSKPKPQTDVALKSTTRM